MRLNDENPFVIQPGYSATVYAQSLMTSMFGFHGQLAAAIEGMPEQHIPSAHTLATKFFQTGTALQFMLAAFPQEEHEEALELLTESFENSAEQVRDIKGDDWNPRYDIDELDEWETLYAFMVLIARDLRCVLDQLEIDRIEGVSQ